MTEVFEAIPEVEAIYLIGEDPVTSEPYQDHLKAKLARLPLLILQDILENETTPFADVVLPAASFLEKDGTFTEAPANRLTLDALDPISRIPEFKVSAVRLEKVD